MTRARLVMVTVLLAAVALLAWRVVDRRLPADPVRRALVSILRDAGPSSGVVALAGPDGEIVVEAAGREADTLVPIGSARKPMTAALLLTFVAEGRLSLDDPLVKHLPAFHEKGRARITIRMLLSHTSGMLPRPPPGYCAGTGTLEACIDKLALLKLKFEPGTAFSYSSADYNTAARLAEVLGGKSYDELLRERILAPLGMDLTELRPAGPGLPDMIGEVWTTPAEYLTFMKMLYDDGRHDGAQLLPAELVRELKQGQTHGVPNRGEVPPEDWWKEGQDYYGFGLWRNVVDEDGGLLVASCDGRGGFLTWLDYRRGNAGVIGLRKLGEDARIDWRRDYVPIIDRLGRAYQERRGVAAADPG